MKRRVAGAVAAVLFFGAACGSGSTGGENSTNATVGGAASDAVVGEDPATGVASGADETPELRKDVTLTLANVGGKTSDRQKVAYFEPFEQKTGIKVQDLAYTNISSQVQTMVDTGKVVWDIVHAGADEAFESCGTLFEEVDYSELGDVFPEGTTNPCSVPGGKYSFIFVYDTEVYSDNSPTRIEDFFDTENFPGKRLVRSNNVRGPLEIALLADGVAPDDLYPLDVDRALAKLDTIKQDLVFVPTWGAMAQQLTNKQAAMALGNEGSMADALEDGAPLAAVFDVNVWDFDSYVIPKGTPNKAEAIAAVKFFLEPEQLINYANEGGLTPVRTDIDPSSIQWTEGREGLSPFAGADRGELVHLDTEYWAENQAEVAEQYVKWQAG